MYAHMETNNYIIYFIYSYFKKIILHFISIYIEVV